MWFPWKELIIMLVVPGGFFLGPVLLARKAYKNRAAIRRFLAAKILRRPPPTLPQG